MPTVINPTLPEEIATEDIGKLLGFFILQARVGIRAWYKDKRYAFSDGTIFSFTHDLYKQEKTRKPDILYYVQIISNDPDLGVGKYGTVIALAGNLAFFSPSEARFKAISRKGNSRVVKIQDHDPDENPIKDVAEEYKYASRSDRCAVKEPVLSTGSPRCSSFLTMRRFPGKNLVDIIEDSTLTTPQRIELSKGLLLALGTQVHNLKLVHRDIKPQNTIVYMGPPKMIINIIDFGFCVDVQTVDPSILGTDPYIAPEIFRKGKKVIQFSSDIYSMGRVLALIWNVSRTYYSNKTHKDLTPEEKLEGLFTGIPELDPRVEDHIRSTLKGMLHNSPIRRLSLQNAISAFSQVAVHGNELVLIEAPAGAGVPPTTSDAGAGVPPTTSDAGAGVPPTTSDTGAGVPPTTSDTGAGVPPTTSDTGAGVPPTTSDAGAGVPPTTSDAGAGVPPTTSDAGAKPTNFSGAMVALGLMATRPNHQATSSNIPSTISAPGTP